MSDPLPQIRVRPTEGCRVRHPDLNDRPIPGEGALVTLTTQVRRQLADGSLVEIDQDGKPVLPPSPPPAAGPDPEAVAETAPRRGTNSSKPASSGA